MEHNFYLKSKKEQFNIQFKIGLAAFAFNLGIAIISIPFDFYFFIVISIIITLSIIAPFYDVPSLKKSGKLVYYSNLFVAEKEKNGVITVHGGTLFDYVFTLNKNFNGSKRTNYILQQYLEGILNLINTYETKRDSQVKIKGTTYILNERTAEKLGLKVVGTDFIQKFILLFNYANLLVTNSFAKRKITFPKLNRIKTFECNIAELVTKRAYIIRLNESLKAQLLHS